MTDLAEVIDVLRGHARSSTCTLEPRDCAALVEKLERAAVKADGLRYALLRHGKHFRGCRAISPRRLECNCGLDAAIKENSP